MRTVEFGYLRARGPQLRIQSGRITDAYPCQNAKYQLKCFLDLTQCLSA